MTTSSSHTQSENFLWIHYIRAVAAFGVVLVHVAADVITEWGSVPDGWWWSANIYDSLARGCVPMFIMVSGSLLLATQESWRDFFRKRFNRVFIPFIAWSMLYLFWKKAFYLPDLGLMDAWSKFISGGICFHLWFFYVLAGLYLITPVFRVFVAQASRRDLLYFIILWFLAGSVLPFAQKIARMFGHDFRINLPMEVVQGFIGYFVLGHFLKKYARPGWQVAAGWIWSVCLLICLFGTWLLTGHFRMFKETLYDNMAPNIALYCAAFFVLVQFQVTAVETRLAPWVKSALMGLSKASFGIYLIHPMILDALINGRLGFVWKPGSQHPFLQIPLMALAGYTASFLVVAGIQRIPYVRRIV